MRAQRALEHLVEPEPRRALALVGEPRAEGVQAPRRPRAPAPGPRRGPPPRSSCAPSRAASASSAERVGRQADHRRGEQPEQRLLVARVGQRGQQVAQVADLLAPPPPAPAGRQRRQPGELQRALVEADLGRRAQQHDDVARRDALLVHERADALGHEPRLGLLDRAGGRQPEAQRGRARRRSRRRRRSPAARPAARAPAASSRPGRRSTQRSCSGPKRIVERAQDLRARAEVRGQRGGPARRLQARAARAEDLDVGVAEARRSPAARRRPCRRCRAPRSSSSSSCSGFVSWNSSTMMRSKRSR